MYKRRFLIAVFEIIALIVLVVACAAPAAQAPTGRKVLRIGSLMPLSGPAAKWGLDSKPALDLYVEMLNKEGVKIGDDLYQIELVSGDGPIYPPSADVAAARSMVYEKKVHAIAIYFGIANAAIAGITNPEKVIFNQSNLFGTYFDPKRHKYCFFGYPTRDMLGWQPIAIMKAIPGIKTLCFTGTKTGDQELEQGFEERQKQYKERFGINVIRYNYQQGTLDFVPVLTKMREAGADVIYSMEDVNQVGIMAKQATQMGWKPYIGWSASVTDLNELRGICGGDAGMENICPDYSAPYYLKNVKVPKKYEDFTKAWREEYNRRFNRDPSTGDVSVALQMAGQYVEACQKAGTIDPDAVMKQIVGGTLDTFTGTYKMSGSKYYGADVVCGYNLGVGIIKGGKLQYLTEWPILDINDRPVE